MQTIQLDIEDNLYNKLKIKNIDISYQFKKFLTSLVDDGYHGISTFEAKQRVSSSLNDYLKNGEKNYTSLNDNFWDNLEKEIEKVV